MRGWGKSLRNAIGSWYEAQGGVTEAAYQMVKYRQRNGWTHRDLLRKAHPSGKDNPDFGALFAWVTQGVAPPVGDARYDIIHACKYATENAGDPHLVAEAIRESDMTWEMIPGDAMRHRQVWEALFERMPMTATIRNLATLTRLGIVAPMSDAANLVSSRVNDADRLRAARIHPIAILSALMTYKAGKGARSHHTWTPVQSVVDALDAAFDKSFAFAPQTGQRFYLGIDVSGSMAHGAVAGVEGLTPRMGAAAMAMAIARRENNYHMAAFADGGSVGPVIHHRFHLRDPYKMMALDISATDSITDVLSKTSQLPWSGHRLCLAHAGRCRKGHPGGLFRRHHRQRDLGRQHSSVGSAAPIPRTHGYSRQDGGGRHDGDRVHHCRSNGRRNAGRGGIRRFSAAGNRRLRQLIARDRSSHPSRSPTGSEFSLRQ